MPFICLANANIPGGALQITDLWPNESQRNGSLDPPGQNRYLNRPLNDLIGLSGAGPITVTGLQATANKLSLEGLGAYIADVVDPGGSEIAAGTIGLVSPLAGDTLTFTGPSGSLVFAAVENAPTGTVSVLAPAAGIGAITLGLVPFNCVEAASTGVGADPAAVQVGDTITIAGVAFVAAALPDLPNQVFDQSGTDQQCSNSLVAAINHANAQALLTAALDALVDVPTLGTLTATNAGGTSTAITLTPSVKGAWGDAGIIQTVGGATLNPTSLTHADANPAVQEFNSAAHFEGFTAPWADVATSLAAAINNAATIIAMDAANAGGPFPGGLNGHMTAVANATVSGVVDLTASQVGWAGALGLTTTDLVNLAMSGLNLGGHAADPAAQEFDSLTNAGSNALVATSLSTTLNDAATDLAFAAIGGSTLTAVAAPAESVTIQADTAGSSGSMPITPSSALRLVVSAGALAKTMVTWTAALINSCVTAVQALVDAGSPCTAVALNAAMNGVAGVSGISVATGASSVADILSILAGRVYQIPSGTVKDPTGATWDAANAAGGFTTPNTVFDTTMAHGEWGPSARWIKHGKEKQAIVSGGDVVNNELGGVRTTIDTTHFASSLQTGQLSHYAAGIGLFPDADVRAFVSDWTRRTNRHAPLTNQRVVTVYNDDGSVLA